MITDEQVMKALDAYYGIEHVGGARESLVEEMRKALEAYEASKWVKFDIDDETTHPRDRQVCNVVYHTGRVNTDKWSDLHRFWVYAACRTCVTHWQPLPEFKEP
jgi:hypothetical protein